MSFVRRLFLLSGGSTTSPNQLIGGKYNVPLFDDESHDMGI